MPEYQLLVFSNNRLVDTERFEADGHLDAIKTCSERHRFERIELWSDDCRIATLASVGTHPASPRRLPATPGLRRSARAASLR